MESNALLVSPGDNNNKLNEVGNYKHFYLVNRFKYLFYNGIDYKLVFIYIFYIYF